MEFVFAVDICLWLHSYNLDGNSVRKKEDSLSTCVSVCVHVAVVDHMQPVDNGSHASVLLNK